METGLPTGGEDRNALLRHIHEQYHESLYSYARGLCLEFRVDVSYADDLMQEFYYSILRLDDTVRTGYLKHKAAYLTGMLRNGMLSLVRKQKGISRREEYFAQYIPQEVDIHFLCMEAHTEEFMQRLASLLDDEEEFELMKLYIEGYKYREIAEMLDMKEGTVSSRIHRAKQALAPHFDIDWKNRKRTKNQKRTLL